MNRVAMTITLLCALSIPVSAGQIPSDGVTSPMPPSNGASTPHVTGQIPTDGAGEQLSEVVLSAVLAALRLLS